MEDGSLASVSVTLGSSVEISRQRYCFANLVAESNLAPYAKNTDDPWQFVADTPELKPAIEGALAAMTPGRDGFVGQFARFAQALDSGTELPVTLADARQTAELLTACYASARSETAVVLPIAPDHPLYGGWQPAAASPGAARRRLSPFLPARMAAERRPGRGAQGHG